MIVAHANSSERGGLWKKEWPLALAVATLAGMMLAKGAIAGMINQPAAVVVLLAALCGVMLTAAVAIVRHADVLAHRLGEPAGTLLLTLAVTGLEVAMVGFVMSTGDEKPTLARDTMFAVVMLVINGFMGVALVLGGLRHGEQGYNLRGANAFLVMIVPLTVLGLVLPNYTNSTPGPTLSVFQMVFLSVMSAAVYGIFLYVQNHRHRGHFVDENEPAAEKAAPGEASAGHGAADRSGREDRHGTGIGAGERGTVYHAGMMVAYGLPLVLLAKQMSVPLDAVVVKLGAPIALGGLIMAVLVLTPESIAAIQAARRNQLQRSVNVLLGSVLASIGLTIPLVITISLLTGRRLVLGLDLAETIMLGLTLVTSMLTFSMPRTNVLPGCVHLLLFAAYFMLVFD